MGTYLSFLERLDLDGVDTKKRGKGGRVKAFDEATSFVWRSCGCFLIPRSFSPAWGTTHARTNGAIMQQ